MISPHLYRLLIVDVVGALSLRWKAGGLDVVDQPRHPARPPGPVVGQPPLACGEVEVVEGVLLSDLVVRLHGSPEVVVTLYCRGGGAQRHRGLRPSEVSPGAGVGAADGEATFRGGVPGSGAQRDMEVLGAGPLVPVVRILELPASQGDSRGRHWVSLQSGQSWT